MTDRANSYEMFTGYRERLRNNERKDMSALGVIALSAGIAGALDIAATEAS